MKSALYLSLLSLFLVPAQLAATVVRVNVWQRPNGTCVTIVGNETGSSDVETQQTLDFIQYAKNTNAHVLAGIVYGYSQPVSTDFVARVATMVRSNGINNDIFNLDAASAHDDSNLDQKLLNRAKTALQEAAKIEKSLPKNFKNDFKKLQLSLAACIKQMTNAFKRPDHKQDPVKNFMLLNMAGSLYESLLTYTLIARIASPALNQKATAVCIENDHVALLEAALKKLGYTRISTRGSYVKEDADALYAKESAANIPSETESNLPQDNRDPLAQSIMNRYALNLKETLK